MWIYLCRPLYHLTPSIDSILAAVNNAPSFVQKIVNIVETLESTATPRKVQSVTSVPEYFISDPCFPPSMPFPPFLFKYESHRYTTAHILCWSKYNKHQIKEFYPHKTP